MIHDPITWKRLRGIFGNPKPISNVTEKQFDCADDKLQQLGRTPYDEIDFGDLWYYHHDLAYAELQPELFAYLFPVCLMDWHQTLISNDSCSHGDSEFHLGIIRGNVFAKMLTVLQRTQVGEVFHDSMLYRMDQERGFKWDKIYMTAWGWMSRLNSLGLFLDTFPHIWNSWWEVETAGRAVCVLEYCSGLMYFDGENPLFEMLTDEGRGDGPFICGNDTYILDRGWSTENVRFIREYVTTERVVQVVRNAAKRLESEAESEQAAQVAAELDDRMELIDSRVSELPNLLAEDSPEGWSV